MMNTEFNMARYLYGNNAETQRVLHEDGFDDGMLNYFYEMRSQRKRSRNGHNGFLHTLFHTAGRRTAFES